MTQRERIMQQAQHHTIHEAMPVIAVVDPGLSPSAMARQLRQTSGDAALCFARVMHEQSAWANQSWGDYWAEVISQV